MTRAMRRMRKYLVVVACIAMVLGVAIGGTVAWLSAATQPVTNTFSPSDINITLDETVPVNNEAKMVPGNTISKDPKVSVTAGSEACWLFVTITKSNNYSTYLKDYTVAAGWTEYEAGVSEDGFTKVYYRFVDATDATAGVRYYVLNGTTNANGEVTVKESVTKTQMKALTSNNYPTLTFKAYAVQSANITDVADAWTQANDSTYVNNANTTNGLTTAN